MEYNENLKQKIVTHHPENKWSYTNIEKYNHQYKTNLTAYSDLINNETKYTVSRPLGPDGIPSGDQKYKLVLDQHAKEMKMQAKLKNKLKFDSGAKNKVRRGEQSAPVHTKPAAVTLTTLTRSFTTLNTKELKTKSPPPKKIDTNFGNATLNWKISILDEEESQITTTNQVDAVSVARGEKKV